MKSFFKRLYDAYQRGKLGHGLLLVSPDERSESFAKNLALFIQALTCSEATPDGACGACSSCRLLQSNYPLPAHPDVLCLKAENSTSGYGVEQIRELHAKLSLSLSIAENRVAWLAGAEGLGGSGSTAGHAFLKGLEEPRPRTFLILSTAQPALLLPTIRSRCQQFRMAKDPAELDSATLEPVVKNWLEIADWLKMGAPQGQSFHSPADDDEFWQERGEALHELEELYFRLWQNVKGSWQGFDLHSAQRVLDFFRSFEKLIQNVRGYAQPQLQWLSLRSDAKLGTLWKP